MVVAVAMEAVEELAPAPAAPNTDTSVVAKGKRTKRQRPHSPIPFAVISPPNTSSSEESTTTEEVNTARCLILLSRGHFPNDDVSRRCDQAATTSYGACAYACKTCGRSFASFQALGGHRASHKKPKNEKRTANVFVDEEDFPSPNSLSLQLSSGSTATFSATMKSPRVHVCSHCGAEFTSGQALGGHMRKHRGAGPMGRALIKIQPEATVVELEPEESKNLGIGLGLDLNLPAPVDEKDKSPKTLIDCHY